MSNRNTTTRDQHRIAIKRTKPPCGICEQPIDYALKWPDPWCFVVDHIIPFGKNPTPERIAELDVLSNKQAAHHRCNRDKWDKQERNVLLICGPAGAGKTTLARSTGLTVFDLDDPHWDGSEALFRQAIGQLAKDPNAQAAVIRLAPTLSSRQAAANMCGASSVTVIETDLETCIQRIKDRGRTPIKEQIAAAQGWWAKYEAGSIGLPTLDGVAGPRSFVTSRAW